MATKVYILVEDTIYPSSSINISTRVFISHKKAEDEMRARYNAELTDWKLTFDDDEAFEVEKSKNSRSIWESGRYNENHISWEIKECEVE